MKRQDYRGGMPPEPSVESTPGTYVGTDRDADGNILHGKHPWAGKDNPKMACTLPPPGWRCTRQSGHDGPCAAVPADNARQDAVAVLHCAVCHRPLSDCGGHCEATATPPDEVQRLREQVAQLEPRAAFGDQCYQGVCEGAYIPQSVVKRLLDEFAAVAAKHRESAAIHADICSSGSDCEVYRTKTAIAGAIESTLAGLPVNARGAVRAEFANELSNDICIQVSDAPLGRVRILIRGPVSENENIVTRLEAAEIHRAVGTYLAATPQPAPRISPEAIAEMRRWVGEEEWRRAANQIRRPTPADALIAHMEQWAQQPEEKHDAAL